MARIEVAAISALKTFDPPVGAAVGCVVLGFSRLGKHLVLDLVDPHGEPLHVVVHLARAGWARWREDPPSTPAPLGRRGGGRGAGAALALRIVFATPSPEVRHPRTGHRVAAWTSPRPGPGRDSLCTWSGTPRRSPAWPGSAPTHWLT